MWMVKDKKYIVTAWIESAVAFEGDVSLNGFHFTSSKTVPNGAIVHKGIRAPKWYKAAKLFNDELLPLLDALSMHRLSAISAYGKSLVVAREDLKLAMAILVDRMEGVGLYLSEADKFDEHKAEIERMAHANDHSLYFFRHALLSVNALSIALNLLQCAESIAGVQSAQTICVKCEARPIRCKNCSAATSRPPATNYEKLREILGDQTYEYFYKRKQGKGNDSVRNKLAHGKYIRSDDVAPQCEPLLDKLKDYYRKEYNLRHVPNIEGARQLIDATSNYNFLIHYEGTIPEPQELLQLVRDHKLTSDTEPGLVPDIERHELLNMF